MCVATGPPIRGDPISQSQSHIPLKQGGGNKSNPHFSAFSRIFSRIFSPARSLLTKEEMHCTFVLVYWFHPLSDG